MKRDHVASCLGGFIIAVSCGVNAAAQEWGAQTSASIGDISSGGGQRNFTFDFDGGAGIPIAESFLDDAVTPDFGGLGPWDRGSGRSFTGLPFSRNVVAPLRAEAILTGNRSQVPFLGSLPAGAVAGASAFVSDQFQYTGASATTLGLTFNLDGVVVDPPGAPVANPLTNIRAQVAVFADTPQYFFLDDVPTLVAEVGATLLSSGGQDAYDPTTLTIEDDTGGVAASRTTTLNFDVQPGQTFYVWQTLRANAAFGTRQADAFSTMTATFSDPSVVQRIGFVIPEPSTGGAYVLLLAIAATRRRRV